MFSIILCGGSGTRLWPLSRKNYPKQFLSLYGENSLLRETYLRMRKIMPPENIILVTNQDNFFNVFNQIKGIEKNLVQQNVLAEPASLNTAPAIALAVKFIAETKKSKPSEPLIILPSDHYIGDEAKFLKTVTVAAGQAKDNIGVIGITPTKPETGYGYIKKGKKEKYFYKVLEFKEKPDKRTAEKYLKSGKYVWNSGMYISNEKTFSEELEKHCPKISREYKKNYADFVKNFKKLPSISIDYAISEKSQKLVVFEGNFNWSDIGSFDSLAEIRLKDKNPRHLNFDSKGVYVHTDSNRLVATLGVENINIVETADCVLVQKVGRAEEVKKIVDYLKTNKIPELEHNLIVHRPWGKYEVLADGVNHKVKKLTVFPGARLSLQSHRRRAEHWVVVKGTAKIVNGENLLTLHENESTYIPAGNKHQLGNEGKENLEIIEVQTGDYFGEDDIKRYKDKYGRMSGKAAAE